MKMLPIAVVPTLVGCAQTEPVPTTVTDVAVVMSGDAQSPPRP
jgi:hypothetical protein